MSCVHYKFFSKLDYSTVTFHGLHITLRELKKQIMGRERLKATKGDLQISNAETSEEYIDDEAEIPRLSSVIVRRIPLGGIKPAGKTFIVHRSSKAVARSSRPKDPSPSMSLAQLAKTANLVDANASEDDKIHAMMLQSNHEYASINYSMKPRGKKERPPFVPHYQSSPEDDADQIPEELLCPICTDLMMDAVVIPCCGNSYCDDCIRTFLLDSEEHTCYTCQESGVSPDNLIANNFLRLVANRFKYDTPKTKHARKQVQQAPLPPPRLQMSRPLYSRQQDPLLANVTHPSPAVVPTAAPQTQVQTPAPSPPAPVTDQNSPMDSTSQGEQPSPGELDPEPTVRRSPESSPDPRPAHIYMAPPSPVYPSPYLYPLSPQPYPPPYISGLLLPPQFGYPPQPIYTPGSLELNPPWIPPGFQPPLSKEYCYKQRRRQDKTTPDEFRSGSRSRISSYSPSRSRSRSPSNGRSYPRAPYSRHNGRSYGRSRSRCHSLLLSPPPLRAGPWEGAEGPAPFRSRSRSPGGFRNRCPVGRQPPPRGLPPYELKGPSPRGHDRWERERH